MESSDDTKEEQEATDRGEDSSTPPESEKQWVLLAIAVFDMLVFLVGTFFSYPTRFSLLSVPGPEGSPRYIGPGAVAVALVCICVATFVGFYYKTGDMRSALTASAWVTYVVLLAAFLNQSVADRLSKGSVAPTLVYSLTSLVGAISGFYFFTSKTVETRKQRKRDGKRPRKADRLKRPISETPDARA